MGNKHYKEVEIKKHYIHLSKVVAMSYKGSYGNYVLTFNPEWEHKDHTEWFTAQDARNFYLIIQGSRDKKDWVSNFRFLKKGKKIKKGKVRIHKGHYSQAKKINDYREKFLSAIAQGKKIVIAGHSAGGGIAQAYCMRMLPKLTKKVKEGIFVFTEGSNRVFNKEGARVFDANFSCVRVENADDPVPKVPNINYRHTKNVIRVGKRQGLLYNLLRFRTWRKNLVDHSPKDYVENLILKYKEQKK